jgi:Concanavalin A-like lectin/glucanases superfamily
MRRNFTLSPLWVCLVLSIPVSAQNTALELNDSNYVFYNGSSDVVNSNGDYTVEFWAYVPSLIQDGQMHQFISQGDPTVQDAFYMGYDASGNIVAGNTWMDVNGNTISTGVPMPVGKWTHLALTWSAETFEATLYVNGVQQATNPNTSFFTDGQNFQIGVQTDGTQPMTGRIDELRAWYEVRTAAQIRAGMLGTTNVDDPNLNLYMNFNEGSGATINNLAASSPNTGVTGTILGKGLPNSWLSSPINFGDNAITLDGVAGQVNIPANSNYDLASGTVEFWVNPTSLSSSFSTVLGNRGAGGVRYSFHLSSTQIAIDNGSGSINTPLNFSVPLGTWTHLAFVNDGTQTTVYINGVANGSIPGGFGSATGQPLTVGIRKNTSSPDDEPFAGGIDEVRVWNIQQPASAILTNMDSTVTGSQTGLVGQFSFNNGNAGIDNTGMINTFDGTANTNDGVLANVAMTGTTSNLVSHPLTGVPLPILLTDFTASRQDNSALLQWQTAQEENTREFLVQRSTDGNNFSTIGTVEAAGNSSLPLNYSFVDGSPAPNDNYYRLEEVDLDGYTTYTPVRLLVFSGNSGQQLIWYPTGYRTAEVSLTPGTNECYTLTDVSGRTLRQGQLSGGKTDISGLPAGLYIVKVLTTTGQGLTTKVLLP